MASHISAVFELQFRSVTRCRRFVKHKRYLVCTKTTSIFFSAEVSAVSSVMEVSCEECAHFLLQLSAMFALLCQSSTGLSLNAIRLWLWLFVWFFKYTTRFEVCDKHAKVVCTHSCLTMRLQTREHAQTTDKMQIQVKTTLGSCFSHNMR